MTIHHAGPSLSPWPGLRSFAVGTAVVPRADDHAIPDPTLSLPLNA